MLLITIFVELRVVARRSRTRAGSPQAASRRPCCAVALRRMARTWARHGHGMANVNQTRPHCVNQMGKTHSKPLAARHGRRTAWVRHAMCESALNLKAKLVLPSFPRAPYISPPFLLILQCLMGYPLFVPSL
jgi:hypothetical protein